MFVGAECDGFAGDEETAKLKSNAKATVGVIAQGLGLVNPNPVSVPSQ